MVEPMVTLPDGSILCTRCGSYGPGTGDAPPKCSTCDGGGGGDWWDMEPQGDPVDFTIRVEIGPLERRPTVKGEA